MATGQSATTITSYFTVTSTLLSSPFRIDGVKISQACAWKSQPFVTSGYKTGSIFYGGTETVSGFLTSKTPISFYLLPDDNYLKWQNKGACGVPASGGFVQPYGALISLEGITSSPFSVGGVVIGKYWLVFVNFLSAPVDVNVELDIWPVYTTSTTVQSQPIVSTTQLSSAPRVLTSSGSEIIGFVPFGNLGLIGIGTLIVVIASVVVVAKRRKASPESELKQKTPGSVQVFRRAVTPSQPIVSTGYTDLDEALEGGLPEGFAVAVVSPAYDERDLLLRKIIESALSSGRPAFYVSNDMGRTQDLVRRYEGGFYAFSSQADKIPGHPANLYKIPSIENLSDASISLTIAIREVRSKEKSASGLMILDILSDILLRHKAITTRKWLLDFVGKRKAEGFTIIATLNPLTTTKEETQSVIDSFDGVIEIYERALMERSRRFLVVKKMYGRRYSENELLLDKDKLF